LAEGKRRKRQKAFAHHLEIALGSQGELEVQLDIAKRVGFLKEKDYLRLQAQTAEVGRMLNGLISSIQDQLDYFRCSQRYQLPTTPPATGHQLRASSTHEPGCGQ
jgi:hypothetical protein